MLATHPTCLLAACATPRRLRRSYSTAPSRARLLNLLFLGSDAFSIHCLRAVLAAQDLAREVQVVTMPEKAVGRGGRGKGKERDGVRRESGAWGAGTSGCTRADERWEGRSSAV